MYTESNKFANAVMPPYKQALSSQKASQAIDL